MTKPRYQRSFRHPDFASSGVLQLRKFLLRLRLIIPSSFGISHSSFSALCSLRGFHLFGVFAEPRLAVAPRTVMECRLSGTDVCCVPFPGFEDWRLQGTPVGKA